jgi:hypothetical protein
MPSERFARVFAWYVRRLLARDFASLRALPGSMDSLSAAQASPGPAIVVITHASWWDPLVGFHLHRLTMPTADGLAPRAGLAPMDAAQLRRFNFFRRLGVFGLDALAPGSSDAMVNYVTGAMARTPRTTLWITAQGRFADPRVPIRLRPGAAAVAARMPGAQVVSLAIEYAFWQERRPEIFVAARAVPAPAGTHPTTAGWLRAMNASLGTTAADLAARVIARDPAGFVPIRLGRANTSANSGRINPIFDLWQRLRGTSGAIEQNRNSERRL